MWTKEDVAAAQRAGEAGDGSLVRESIVTAIMTRTAEIIMARGGTMTAEDLDDALEYIGRDAEHTVQHLRGHITTQGATVADLGSKLDALAQEKGRWDAEMRDLQERRMATERERAALQGRVDRDKAILGAAISMGDELKRSVAALRAEVEWLKAESTAWSDATACASPAEVRRRADGLKQAVVDANLRVISAESRLASIRERAKSTEEIRRRFVEALASHCTPEAAALVIALWVWEADGLEGDAPQDGQDLVEVVTLETGMVGGPQKTEVFVRYPCSPACTHDDAATPGHPERVKERSEALIDAIEAAENLAARERGLQRAYHNGAEAMRAACWEAVQTLLQQYGMHGSNWANALKAAIEGAAP